MKNLPKILPINTVFFLFLTTNTSMKTYLLLFFSILTILSCSKKAGNNTPLPPKKIAFGSCCFQLGDLSIFKTIEKQNPDLYLALGDNMYVDMLTFPGILTDSAALAASYTMLKNNPYFRTFKERIPFIATWDDHDYGGNNKGNEYPYKEVSQRLFLNFFNEPKTSDRWKRPGVYTSYYFGDEAHRLQIIVLDTRTFLDVFSAEPIAPTSDTSKRFLGNAEWIWLKGELQKPAQGRIVMTSTQMLHEHNGYESWTNYPHELARFFQLIRDTRAEGVFMVSGDVHWAELSKQQPAGLYPLYDMTSSGLNMLEFYPVANKYRVGNATRDLNFGMIDIDWESNPINIALRIYNQQGIVRIEHTIPLSELKF